MKWLKSAKGILTVVLVLTWLILLLGGYLMYSSNQKAIAKKDEEIAGMKYQLEQIGELIPIYQVATDVAMGKKIEEADLQMVNVPLASAGTAITDSTLLLGKYFKTDLVTGTNLTPDLIYDDELTNDMRYLDVVLHSLPVGIEPGAFVDVRILLPSGQDFIAMSKKKIASIDAGVLKLIVDESEINVYNSLLLDSYLYTGTQLYAVEYVEGGIQQSADTFYPMSSSILAVAQKNPNLIDAIKSDILIQRETLEGVLSSTKIDEEEINRTLELERERFREQLTDAEREFQIRMEREAELAAEASLNGGY